MLHGDDGLVYIVTCGAHDMLFAVWLGCCMLCVVCHVVYAVLCVLFGV